MYAKIRNKNLCHDIICIFGERYLSLQHFGKRAGVLHILITKSVFALSFNQKSAKFLRGSGSLKTLMLVYIHPDKGCLIYRHGVGVDWIFCVGRLPMP